MAEYREEICCTNCNSTSINIVKKGFGLGKAVVGGILTGGYGLAAGFLGSNNLKATCLACGKIFDPKDGYIKIRIDEPVDMKDVESKKIKDWDEQKRKDAIADLSDEDREKKFKTWERLYEKGLITKPN